MRGFLAFAVCFLIGLAAGGAQATPAPATFDISPQVASITLAPSIVTGTAIQPYTVKNVLELEIQIQGQQQSRHDITLTYPSLCSDSSDQRIVLQRSALSNEGITLGVLAGLKVAGLAGEVYYSFGFDGEMDQQTLVNILCENNATGIEIEDFRISGNTINDTLAVTILYDASKGVELPAPGTVLSHGDDGEPFNGIYFAVLEAQASLATGNPGDACNNGFGDGADDCDPGNSGGTPNGGQDDENGNSGNNGNNGNNGSDGNNGGGSACNNGVGNGSDDCDPGNSGGTPNGGQDDDETEGDDSSGNDSSSCNNGLGNGSDDCDPGGSGGTPNAGQDDNSADQGSGDEQDGDGDGSNSGCNNGLGNGSDGCDPGGSGGTPNAGQDDG